MEFAREVDHEATAGRGRRIDAETLLLLLAPFAPHITEELWQRTGNAGSVHDRGGWPAHDPALAARVEVEVAVQVNGKLARHASPSRPGPARTSCASARWSCRASPSCSAAPSRAR